MRIWVSASILLAIAAVTVAEPDGKLAAARASVAGWRGDGGGVFKDAEPPTEWDQKTNLKWTAKTGATAHASPVIMNGKVFIVSEPNELYAVDLADGKVLWKKTITADALGDEVQQKLPERAGASGVAAATPLASDGRVFVVLGNGIVACFQDDGVEAWTIFLDQKQVLQYGRSASPLLAGGKLLVMAAHLTALDPANGKVIWEATDAAASYGTPALARIGDTEVVVTPRGDVVGVSEGKILLKEIGKTEHTTPLVHGDIVYFVDEGGSAARLPAKVEASMQATPLWTSEIQGETFASPVLHEGRLHTINKNGTYRVLDAKTGKVLLKTTTRLNRTDDESANLYPSLTLAGKYLFIANDRGTTLLLEPGVEYQEIRRNQLASGAGSSPVFWGQHIFLRGERRLLCIGP